MVVPSSSGVGVGEATVGGGHPVGIYHHGVHDGDGGDGGDGGLNHFGSKHDL